MADRSETTTQGAGQTSGLEALARSAQGNGKGLPPVHLWNPPHCGDIGLKIVRDGTWYYQGSPIGRPALVRLFSTILRKDPDGHVLVTPVEKIAIEVEDAPFIATAVDGLDGPDLWFETNVGDRARADAEHPLRFEQGPSGGLKPYVRVRGDLWALVSRPVFYELVERGETRSVDGREMFGVASAGQFFPMAPAEALGDLSGELPGELA
jgi:hypothetical protein